MIDGILTTIIIKSNLCLRDKDFSTQTLVAYVHDVLSLLNQLDKPSVPDFYVNKPEPVPYNNPVTSAKE